MTNFDKYLNMLGQAGSDKKGTKIQKTICPRYFGKPCIVCDKVAKYLKKFDDRKAWSNAKKALTDDGFFPNTRYYMNLVFLANPSDVVLFEAPPTIGEPMAKLQVGDMDDFKNFMHPTLGRNLYVKKEGEKNRCKYYVTARAQVTPLPDMSVLKRLYDLSDLHLLLDDENVNFMRASQLDDDSTAEVRVLPNWDFTNCMKDPEAKKIYETSGFAAFLVMLAWHFGIGPETFDMYNTGQLALPFEEGLRPGGTTVYFDGANDATTVFNPDQTGATVTEPQTEILVETTPPEEPLSDCIGGFEKDSIICQACESQSKCIEAMNVVKQG